MTADLAFGYEAVARAYKVLGDEEKQKDHYKKALEAAEQIAKKEDRDYFLGVITLHRVGKVSVT